MRVYPPESKAEIAAQLTAHAKLIWGDQPPISETVLDTVAEALALVTAIEVPDSVEPLFP